MLTFTKDANALDEALSPYKKDFIGFEANEWMSKEDNIAITDGHGNWSMFDKGSDGIYTGHYFFQVRGRSALNLGKEMIEYFFTHTDAKAIRGLTPLTNLGARWMSRQLGFQSHGVVQTLAGPCELFIKIKENRIDG